VDYPQFQIAAVELASEGTPLTVANVVVGLRIGASEAGRHLERMTKEGHLEADFDTDEGVAVYRVRGLTPKPRGDSLVGTLRNAAIAGMVQQRLGLGGGSKALGGAQQPRKIVTGALIAGLVPGLGLAYAAPWKVVAAATVVVVVVFKVLSFFSLFMLGVPFLVVSAVVSAILGALYTWQYNKTGRRTELSNDPEIRRRLPGSLKNL
jgi:hypothetical protein